MSLIQAQCAFKNDSLIFPDSMRRIKHIFFDFLSWYFCPLVIWQSIWMYAPVSYNHSCFSLATQFTQSFYIPLVAALIIDGSF